MNHRSHRWLAALTVLASAAGVAGQADHAAAGPVAVPGAGDGAAVITFDVDTGPHLTAEYRYNSSGGGITAGRLDDTHFWVAFQNLGGATHSGAAYTSAQLTNWLTQSPSVIDPVCTVDSTKNNGVDLTVYFQCTPFTGHTLQGEALFLTVTNAAHPDRAGVTAPGFVAVTTASASNSHTPTNQYRSSGTGAATVTRLGAGRYLVAVPNGAYAKGQGVAFASALSVKPATDPYYTRYCNPQSWGPNASGGTAVYVNCYGGLGDLRDAQFSLRLSTRNHMGGAQPGGSQWVSSPDSPGYTASGYGWNSAGGANVVRSLAMWEGIGASEVTFSGATWAPARVESIMVSAYGGNHRCSFEYLGHSDTEGHTFESVHCYVPSTGIGVANGKYSISLAQL